MKKRTFFSAMILILAVSFLFTSFNVGASFAKSTAKPKQMTMTGMLEESNGAFMVKSGKKTVAIQAKEDLKPMVGKEVKAWGTMKKGEKGNPVMEATKVEEITKK